MGARVRDRYLEYQRDPYKFLAENPLRTNSNKKPLTCYKDVRQAAIALHGTNPTRMARQLMRHQVRKAHEKGLKQFQRKEAS